MSDQHVVRDWRAYFASLGPGVLSPLARDFSPPHEGFGRCSASWASRSGLESLDMPEGENLLDWAMSLWEANGRPEMWVFANRSGPPWHMNAQPSRRVRMA